jgi:hypothetical protein
MSATLTDINICEFWSLLSLILMIESEVLPETLVFNLIDAADRSEKFHSIYLPWKFQVFYANKIINKFRRRINSGNAC